MDRLITIEKTFQVSRSLICLSFVLMASICLLSFVSSGQQTTLLACNDKVQVSLDDECLGELEFDMFLEGNRDNYDDLRLVVKGKHGELIIDYPTTSAELDGTHIGQDLSYQVFNTINGNSCWGKIWVEDHIPPQLVCEDVTVNCANSVFPGDPIVKRYELTGYSVAQSGANNEVATLSFDSPPLGITTIHDVRLFMDVEAEPLSDLSVYMRIPSNELDTVMENPLDYNEDMNCLNSGIVAWFNDKKGAPNKELHKNKNCRLQTTPSIFGKFKTKGHISEAFEGEAANGTYEVIFEMNPGTSFDPDWINNIIVEVLVVEGYINIPVHDPGAEFVYLGNNQFRVEGLGLCDAVLAEFKDYRTDECKEYEETPTIAKILRCWTVHDANGNSATCCDTIYLRQSNMDDLVCPPNWDDNDLPAFDCPSDYAGYELPNGAPDPHVTGYPYDRFSLHKDLCSNMQTAYDDQIIKLKECGSSFKVVRNWTILDWCNSHLDHCIQIIKVVDDVQPVLECAEEYVVYMDDNPYKCGVDFKVPPPKVISECNNYTWTVEYLVTGDYGDCSPPKSSAKYEHENVYYSGGEVYIKDLPMGCSWIRYIVTDECGNVSDGKCRVNVKVKDNIPPVPVCDETTTVAVTYDGYAALHASSLDDGSWDNCMVDSFAVAKMTDICHEEKDPAFQADIFQDKIKFCCEEVGESLRVRLRVWDKYGNYNDCMVMVEIQDKIPPQLVCPPDLTLDCQTDHKNLELTGKPEYYDNCIVNEPTYEDIEYLDQCGTGHLYRVWTVTDQYGQKSSCTQHIYLRDFDPFEMEDWDFPEDVELLECFADASPDMTGKPNLDDDDKCSLVAATFEDQVFKFVDDACRKIIREWTVIDWCQFEGENDCVTQSLVNHEISCPETYDPVCGCNGETYDNACIAKYQGGVKYWIDGPCNKECKTPLNLTEIYERFGHFVGDSELREIKWDSKFYYVLIDSLNCDDIYDPWTIHSDTLVFDCFGALVCEYGEDDENCPWYLELHGLPPGRTVWDCDGFPEITHKSETGIHGLWRLSQIIKVNNYEAPEFFSSCENRVLCSYGPGCGGEVELKASATDDCTLEENFRWHWMVYEFGQGYPNSPAYSGHGVDASGYYPDGKHRIVWTVEDQCGNVSRCDYYFTVVDCKSPTPYCISSVTTVVMPINGQTELWARDFDNGSEDNCTLNSDLVFSFTEDTDDQSIILDCNDIPNGRSAYIELKVYVTDEEGNQDYCIVELDLQDNAGNFCENLDVGTAFIEGKIRTESDLSVPGAEVMIENDDLPEFPKTTETGPEGDFQFTNLRMAHSYRVHASKPDDAINGVSTFDLVKIQQHIIGMQDLDSPYKIIAADADNSGSITASDLLQIRKLILGVADEFPNGRKIWVFIDERSEFDDANRPFPYSEVIEVESLDGNHRYMDFMAIKTGDVNGNAKLNQLEQPEIRSGYSLDFIAEFDPKAVQDEIISIPVKSGNFTDILGFQFTLKAEANSMNLVGIAGGAIPIDGNHIALHHLDRGMVSVSWNDVDPQSFSKDETLFYLQFERSSAAGGNLHLELNSEITAAEAYHSSQGVIQTKLQLENESGIDLKRENHLYQNTPNPFSDYTHIAFELVNEEYGILSILDLSGRVLWKKEDVFKKGLNELVVEKSELAASGILYYNLETSTQTMTKKMIAID